MGTACLGTLRIILLARVIPFSQTLTVVDRNSDDISVSPTRDSAVPRSTKLGKRAILGVRPNEVAGGVQVSEITRDSAAHQAGLLNGDIIAKFNQQPMTTVTDLVNFIRLRQPGDEIEIEYFRDGSLNRTTAVLASYEASSRQADQFKMMNRLGAIPSRRARNFPMVFQHDAPLFPEDCGGPIVDLEGRVLGVNIAREGRASSYAIPSYFLKTVLSKLLREDVASRN